MNVLTFDVEDWYHCLAPDPRDWSKFEDRIVGAMGRLLEILAQTDTKATFFVLGHVAKNHPDLIREIVQRGHEVACHGMNHQLIYHQTPADFEDDVRCAIQILQELVAQPILGYRAPFFSITRRSSWALTVLRQLGFAYDSSVFPVLNHRYGIPTAPRQPYRTKEGLLELPPSTLPVFGLNVPFCGGVYFRFAPYWLVRWMFRQLNRRGESVIFYLHPWELDAGQPKIALPAFLRFRHYYGLKATAGKLERLLQEFCFGPARELL